MRRCSLPTMMCSRNDQPATCFQIPPIIISLIISVEISIIHPLIQQNQLITSLGLLKNYPIPPPLPLQLSIAKCAT